MSAGRWRVYRLAPCSAQPWVVAEEKILSEGYGRWTVSWKQFLSWREAYDYADKQARR